MAVVAERETTTQPARDTEAAPSRWGPAQLLSLVVCLGGLFGAMRPAPDPDPWWHLATGEWILRHGTIPRTDPFSWTAAGRLWTAHEWGSETIFALIDRSVGPIGLLVFQGLLVGIALFVLRTALHKVVDNEWAVAAGLVVALYLSSLIWTLRPHLFSFLGLTLFLETLVSFRGGGADKRIWLLVPLTAVWANLHGGFVAGVLLIWLFAVVGLWERHSSGRRLSLIAILASLAGAVNPAGPEIYLFSLYVAQVTDRIAEWQPTGLRDPRGIITTLIAFGIPTILAIKSRKIDAAVLITAVVFGVMAIGAIRNVALAGAMMAPALAMVLGPIVKSPGYATSIREKFFLGTLAIVATLAGCLIVVSGLQGRSEAFLRGENEFPATAAEALSDLPPGRMANPYDWGGYLIWKLPDRPVSVDGRTDLYGFDLLDRLQTLERLKPGWRRFLDDNHVVYVLWQRERPLAEALRLTPGWTLVHKDREAVVFARDHIMNDG